MMKFASQLHQFGFETATQAVNRDSGLRVDIVIPESDQLTEERMIRATAESRKKSGTIVGFANARRIEKEPVFEGIAVMENSKGQGTFVAVLIKLDGTTILNPAAHVQYPDPHKERLMQDLYPKSK